MSKIRINDLARELEVKSRVILEALPAVGCTEHKTHSSAVEPEIAERVRRYLRGEGGAVAVEAPPAAEPESPAPAVPEPPEPPAVAAETPAAPVEAPKTAPPPERPRPSLRTAPAPPPAAPLKPRLPAVGPRPVYAAPMAPVAPRPAAPTAARPAVTPPSGAGAPPTPAAHPHAPAPASAAPTPAALAPPRPAPRVPTLNVSASQAPAASAPPPAVPGRRVIVPVAPQRPVYQAPPPGAAPVTRGPIGRPAPGKPIYQRPTVPRPGTAPVGRAATPEGRREPRVKEGMQRIAAPALTAPTGPLPITREITINEGITVKDLSERLQARARDVIRKLFDRGLMVTVNQALDAEIATQIAREFGADAKTVSFEEAALQAVEGEAEVQAAGLVPRAPVVTIMGHVDHGKTSLLDAIRETNIAAGEAGGITQHIGAYQVEIQDKASPAYGRRIVFIDTPGHEAFTRMRARGARVTDVVVLVVAADDGVMPQTLEAIDHARAANVPIIVAINKIDKPDAQPDRVKKQLADRGLLAEDWGGTTVMVNVSARAHTNLNQLLEMILLVTDLQELKANPEAPAQGTVLEAELDRGRGPVARVLVQDGTLRLGDNIILGSVLGRVRALFDDRGRPVEEAGPSTPVEVLGLEGLPEAGDRWAAVTDRNKARQIALYREEKARESALARASRMNLETLSQQMAVAGGEVKELPLIIKADVQGSAEVLVDSLAKLSTDKVKVRVIHSGVGAINENDVLLASASNAVVIGFNVRPDRKAAEIAEREKVEIRLHSIIYELLDEMKKAMSGLLAPIVQETSLGRAEVRQTFRIPKIGMVAGCYVRDGKLTRDAQVRVVRDGKVVYTSKISSLRRFKEDVAEVRNGLECGIGVANFSDVKPGDVLEAFQIEKIAPTLGA